MSKNKKHLLSNEEVKANQEENIEEKVLPKSEENLEAEEVVVETTEEIHVDENTSENVETVEEVMQEEILDIKGSVLCELLNVRKEPNKNSEILTVVSKDTLLTILDKDFSEEFYKVLVNNIEGYCMKKFIAIVAE